MGVHGLWDLVAPVGRRVSVETLAGKRLAIDASIWMIQFMKAMRDEKGEMVRNAHILGFFRRICKLLYLRTKPVFVFDGGTPALKRRTVIARRRQRDNAQAKIRKTAEKLLLSRVKEMKLKELADDLQKQMKENDVKGKRPISQESFSVRNTEKENDNRHPNSSQEQLDEMLAASLAAEENEDFAFNASTSRSAVPDGVSVDGEEDEEMILPEMHGKVDPAILAALPPSLQLDLLVQMRERLMAENRQKYQKVKKAPASFSELQIQAYLKTVAFRREIDVVQKAAAGGGMSGVQTSRIASEANREFIFSSSFTGDKLALTSVGQERVGADQSQAPPLNISTEFVNKDMKTRSSGSVAGSTDVETGKEFPEGVETYRDERGHLRISKVRALGIHMTRDLQRNLDMMKEIEHREVEVDLEKNRESATSETLVDIQKNSCDERQYPESNDNNNNNVRMIHKVERRVEPAASNRTSIEISFADVAEHDELENDDDTLFACLVAGNPVIDFSWNNSTTRIQSLHSDSDVEWEGDIEKTETKMLGTRSSHSDSDIEWEEGSSIEKKVTNTFKGCMSSQGKVEGEEGFEGIQKPFSCSDSIKRTVTKGSLQEEADLQEAIRRSLMDKGGHESVNNFGEEPEAMASSTNVCLSGGTRNILETNCLGSNSSAFINLNPDKNNLDGKILNQDGGTSGALTGQVFGTSDVQPGAEICSENGNDHARSKQVGTCDSEMTINCLESGYSVSFNDSVHERSVDSVFTEAQDSPHGVSNKSSFDTTKLGNISHDGMLTDADGVKELLKDEVHGKSVVGEKGPLKKSFVDDIKEYEIMKDHLEEEMLFLGKEQDELEIEQRKLERNAESVSSEMFVECQELLQMFGLPYIIAPMEAEAQCAFMEMSNLVDGVVTDDSDAFLFGSQCVYKNIFDDRKYVETYLMKDIANELGLDREKLILMALLLGSDYTEGVSGIGIVNAIEVVNAFPEKDGLCEFRAWIESPDPSILGNIDAKSRHNRKGKGSKGENNTSGSNMEGDSCDQNVPKPVDDIQRIKQVFMEKHRNVSKIWHIPANFPSDAVISAYDSPQVDKSTEPFAWGKPDLHALRKLCWEKFAWGTEKADELLLPVLKEYNKHETQMRLEAFYSFNERFAKIRSKRIKKAVKGMTGVKSSELMDEVRPQQAGSGRKRKPKQSEDGGVCSTELDGAGASDPNDGMGQLTVKKPRARRAPQKNLDQPIDVSGHPDPRKGVHVRGRMRGKGRGQLTGRASRERKSYSMDYENEESSSGRDQEMQSEKTEETHIVRRSRRLRKTISYKVSDESDASDKENENCPELGFTVESIVNEADNEAIRGVHTTVVANELTENVQGTDTMTDSVMNDNQIYIPLNQTESSKDYLQFGGGFCMEKDEQAQLDEHVSDSATSEMITQKSDIPESAISENHEIDQLEVEPNMNDNTQSNGHPLDDDCDSDSANHDRILLRAMPNLRKKRRT